MFYALVTDLVGASQEPIDPDDGSVAGWVYNRFRFYDPWSGVYGSQDPLGVVPNPATPYGYVGNPVLWVDPDALKAYSGVLSDAMLTMMRHVDDIAVNDKALRNIFNVAGMVDMDGNIYLASGAAHNLNPVDYPRLNIVSLGDPSVIEQLPYEMRLPFHAEQKLLNYVKANNLDVAAIYIYLLACQDLFKSDKYMKIIQSGIMDICNTCDRVMNKSGLFRISDSHFYVTNEMRKILIGDANLFQKSAKFIARGLR